MIKKVFLAYGMMKKIFREAYISISAYKTRTFLTMLGIIIGVAAVVIMVSAGQAVQNMNLMLGFPETDGLLSQPSYV